MSMRDPYGRGGQGDQNGGFPVMRTILGGFIAIIGLGVGIYFWKGYDQVDPGNAGVLLDYCDGTQTTITDSRYIWVGWRCNRLAEYPTAEFTLDQIINIEAATAWAVDPGRVADLYRMRPNIALVGDSKNQDISSLVVTSEVRAGVRDACTQFGWEEAYGPKRAEYEKAAEAAVQGRLEAVAIKVRTVSIRNMDPSPELDTLIAARLEGQKLVEAAAFTARQAEGNGAAQQATQRAAAILEQQKASDAAKLSQIQNEAATAAASAQAQAAKIKADSDAQVAVAKSGADAEDIRLKGDAQAAATKAQAAAVTPTLVEFTRWSKWDGKLPANGSVVSTSGPVTVPPAGATP